MRGRWAWLGALAAALTGCGNGEPARVADACLDPPARIVTALAAAPDRVELEGGTTLSDCVRLATDAGDLQNVGAIFSSAGSALRHEADRKESAAVQLGYLVGAVEKGARNTGGFQDELVFRMRSFADDRGLPAPRRAALERGRRAGRAAG